MQPWPTPHPLAGHPGRWRRHAAPGLLALALACPGLAHPISLDQLLRLPLEHLLQLDISPRRASASPDASGPRQPAAARGPT